MTLHANALLLKNELESISLFEGRYSHLVLVNIDPGTGQKRGCFSLVFKAFDSVMSRFVAIKFYDPDPRWLQDNYRLAAFRREHDILKCLIGAERCLQLVSPLSVYEIKIPLSGGQNAVLPCEYFVTDWLDEEIDDYFLSAAKYSAQEKIKLFVDMLLALEALHSYEVFHRDLKADNLRACQKAVRRVVVAIDMGAAARFESGCIQSHYGAPVGAIGYAAPESTCGMAANRLLAPATDYFALGCLLYELFNADYFYHVTRYLNANFDVRLTAMQSEVLGISGDQAQVDAWKRTLAKFSAGVIEVPIDGIGSTVPRGVAGILNEVLAVLTNIDYRKRYSCGKWVRAKLGSALKVIENEALYQRQLSLSRERRRKKILAIAAKRDRLVNFLESRGGNGNSQVT